MSEKRVPDALGSVLAIASLTLKRLLRGRAVMVSLIIAGLPVLYGLATHRTGSAPGDELWVFEILAAAVLAPMFVASSIGEEIEDRTTTYLWSRPIPRWSIVAGKLVAFIPVTTAVLLGSWTLSHYVAWSTWPEARPLIALAVCVVAFCIVSAGIATIAPKHGMALTICYILFFDSPLGIMPATLREISITHQVRSIAGTFRGENAITQPAIALCIIAALWLALIGLRLRRLEA